MTLSKLLYPLLLILLLLPVGCDQSQTEPAVMSDKNLLSQPELQIGLIPEQNIFTQKERYQPLMDYLAAETGVAIKLHVLTRYGNLIDNFISLNLDGAFFGSFTGAMAIKRLGVVPLARPQFKGGRSTYYGLVFVRKGSGIKTAEDMRGKRMVFVDRATTAGYLLPLAYFHQIGIANYSGWFSEYYFSGTHEDAIRDVLNGAADIGAAKDTVFYRMAAEDNRLKEELEILATSPQVPANGLAVRQDLPEKLKSKIRDCLLTMHQKPLGRQLLETFGAEKFLLTTKKDYQPVLDYATEIGIDLATYNYLNN